MTEVSPKLGSFLSRYLSLFQVTSLRELEDRVVSEVCAALRQQACFQAPIRLSKVAKSFSIHRQPSFSPSINEGCITYENELGAFRICLSSKVEDVVSRNPLQSSSVNSLTADEHALFVRARFTYAHEFAHRFFFVSTDRGWKRGIEVASKSRIARAQMRSTRRLAGHEERLCDRIAGRLLVPELLLAKHFASTPNRRLLGAGLTKRLRDLALTYQVSNQCLTIQFIKCIAARVIPVPDSFVFMTIDSATEGDSQEVRSCIVMSVNSQLTVPYPGSKVEALGRPFAEAILELANNTRSKPPIRISSAVQFARKATGEPASFRLNGFGSVISTSGKAKGCAVWGELKTV